MPSTAPSDRSLLPAQVQFLQDPPQTGERLSAALLFAAAGRLVVRFQGDHAAVAVVLQGGQLAAIVAWPLPMGCQAEESSAWRTASLTWTWLIQGRTAA